VLVLLGSIPCAFAAEGVGAALSADDRIAFEQVLRSQLAAFEADDGNRAFGYASKGIRDKFRTPEAFMTMVRERYRPVYRPREVASDGLMMSERGPVQQLSVLGPDGMAFTAIYIMEPQPDAAWKIGGCILFPRDTKAA
jgi:hypothetical protein